MVDLAGNEKLPELIGQLICSLGDVDVTNQQDKLNIYRFSRLTSPIYFYAIIN